MPEGSEQAQPEIDTIGEPFQRRLKLACRSLVPTSLRVQSRQRWTGQLQHTIHASALGRQTSEVRAEVATLRRKFPGDLTECQGIIETSTHLSNPAQTEPDSGTVWPTGQRRSIAGFRSTVIATMERNVCTNEPGGGE